MPFKPFQSLQKRTLLGIFLMRVTQVTPGSKSMLHAAIQIDLIIYLDLLKNLLCLVALFRREEIVVLRRGDREGCFDLSQLVDLDVTGVCCVPNVQLARFAFKVADHVFATKAVANTAYLL